MRVSVAIMAHPKREDYVGELLASLDAPADVVWDQKNDRWDTGRRALLAYRDHPEATHHLVLQDDAIVCRDLVAAATRAVEVIPDAAVSLFFCHASNTAHQRLNRTVARVKMPTWVVFEGPWWGVAVVLPVGLIDHVVSAGGRPQRTPAYDKRISRALIAMDVPCYYVLPSLVEHRTDGPSMVEGRKQDGRRAHHFIGRKASALEIDWKNLPFVDKRGNRLQPRQARAPLSRVAVDRYYREQARRSRHRRYAPEPALRAPRLEGDVEGTRVSVAIMAHPRRREWVAELQDGLDASAEVVWDREDDRWDTGSRAVGAYDPDATHHLVVQDDALVCRDLVAGVRRAAAVAGNRPVSLYTGRVRPSSRQISTHLRQAAKTGSSWVALPGPWWGVGVVLPTATIDELLRWCAEHPVTPNYDLRLTRYFQTIGVDCWYTVPSLVDHRHGPGVNPSLVKGRQADDRRAWNFIGQDASALDVDWTAGPVAPPEKGYFTVEKVPRGSFYQCWDCGHKTVTEQRMHAHRDQHERNARRKRARREAMRGP